jgi:alginate O-acetyltransferase complex protein AlgI
LVFSSPTFLFVFLPIALLAAWATPTRFRRYTILLESVIFYAWGVQAFVFVLLGSALIDWALALGIVRARARGKDRQARALLILAIAQSLGLLGYFKYGGFAAGQIDQVAGFAGLDAGLAFTVLLPIGISFFTFELVSYVVDVWREVIEPRRDPIDLLVFVSLFPRSIAGPIVRMREIQDDLREPRPSAEQIGDGAVRFAYGLAKKVLIADQIAPVADAAFAAAADGTLTTTSAWIGIFAYTLQIYYDFSGYTDMAIGIAMMLGFRLPENFRRPYSSLSITDYWRRWHMTLARWFRDYVYIPLGGSRGSTAATYRNLLIVFCLTGFWHGAEWTFVIWGLYHGTWLLIERITGLRGGVDEQVRHVVLRRASTFLIVMVGFVIFRSPEFGVVVDYYHAMVVPHGGATMSVSDALDNWTLVILLLASVIVFLPRADRSGGQWIAEATGPRLSAARFATLAVLFPLALVFALSGSFSPFLYFQF